VLASYLEGWCRDIRNDSFGSGSKRRILGTQTPGTQPLCEAVDTKMPKEHSRDNV